MGFFDFLSGSDEAEQAAAANRAALDRAAATQENLYGGYQTNALGALGTARTNALGALSGGLQNTIGAYQQGLDATREGQTGALAAGRAGVDAFAPLNTLAGSYKPAVDTYYSSLGLTDPSAALKAFQTGPGYQFQQDEAARATGANASRLGISGSGNTLQALGDRAQNIANTTYGAWQDRLAPFVGTQLAATGQAATGIAGANRTLADIYGSSARDIAGGYGQIGGAYGTNAAQTAGLETGYGADVGNVYGNVTAGRAQTSKDVAAGNIAANNQIAQAGQTDASNFWGLLGAGVKAAGSYFGKPA